MTDDIRGQIAAAGRYLRDRGLAPGSSGNVSIRIDDTVLITPTNSRLGAVDPTRLSQVSMDGHLMGEELPSKELFLHLGLYAARPEVKAVVHLHATYSVAASCLDDINMADAFPPVTAYSLMRLGRVPVVSFHPPGSEDLADDVARLASGHKAMLLSNHGSLVASTSLDQAVADAEELEQAARLLLLLAGQKTRLVPERFVDDLRWTP